MNIEQLYEISMIARGNILSLLLFFYGNILNRVRADHRRSSTHEVLTRVSESQMTLLFLIDRLINSEEDFIHDLRGGKTK